jgi:hypothetical protein
VNAGRIARTRRVRALGALGVLTACLAVALTAGAQSAVTQPFSAEERARLANGELVSRPVTERHSGLRLLGGSSWQLIDATPDAVFRTLLETRFYHRMLPAVSGAKLISAQGNTRRVRIEHKKGPLGVAYRLALQIDPVRRDITFKLNDRLESGMRAAWGFLTVHPYGAQKTLLAYGVMADPGDGLLVSMVRGVIHEWLMKVPLQVKRFVEGSTGRAFARESGAARVCADVDGGQPQKCAP